MKDLEIRARARVGTLLRDKWHLDALLGIGGMATVYSATHRNLKRAAIKMLHPELSSNDEMRSRFLREGYVANSVAMRGVVRVVDDDVTDDGAAFLVMELLEGETSMRAGRARARRSASCRCFPTWTNFSTCSSRRTRRASSTAISSRRICSSCATAHSKCSTSGSRACASSPRGTRARRGKAPSGNARVHGARAGAWALGVRGRTDRHLGGRCCHVHAALRAVRL